MVLPPRYGLSLCAGGGGLDMGLGLAEPGFATSCYVEIEDYPRRTLIAGQRAGYLHPAPIWDDLKTFDARPWRGQIDTLLAGYPCQPFSQAGQRKGENDPRHLWPDICRIVDKLQPRWCFFENVAGHLSLGLDAVVDDLRRLGFRVAVGIFSAGETGATHERQRVFIVAHCECRAGKWKYPSGQRSDAGADWRHNTERCGGKDFPLSRGNVGNTARIGWGEGRPEHELRFGWHSAAGAGSELADSDDTGLQGEFVGVIDAEGRQIEARHARLRGGAGIRPPGPADMDAWKDVLAVHPDGAPALSLGDLATFSRYIAALVEAGQLSEAAAERRLRRMADGMAARSRALRLLGNGVHPLAAAYAWRTLAAAHGLGSVDLGVGAGGDGTTADGDVLT